jgi:hypothetical protein
VLEAAEVRERIDEQLRPGARSMPSLALGGVLDEALGVQIEGLALARPRPGVLRLSAQLRLSDEADQSSSSSSSSPPSP